MDDYFDIIATSRPIATSSPDAQIWFDRGLAWIYGFNHEEAVLCFRKVLACDPGCAIAWWGIALGSGPFYNMPWDWFSAAEAIEATAICHHAARNAVAASGDASASERALIDAMREAYRAHPDDHDLTTLFAEALMTLTPWKLWNTRTGEPAEGAATLEALGVVERALSQRVRLGLPLHAGLLHMHIHLLEMSTRPEQALGSANMLVGIAPEAGHLEHMPCHIYALCGQYHRAVDASARAIAMPMPRLPPVTSAALPCSPRSIAVSYVVLILVTTLREELRRVTRGMASRCTPAGRADYTCAARQPPCVAPWETLHNPLRHSRESGNPRCAGVQAGQGARRTPAKQQFAQGSLWG